MKILGIFREFPRQFWIIFFGSLISATGAGLVFPFMTLYLRHKLSISMTSIGLLFGLLALVGLVPQAIGGFLTDSLGRKFMMLLSLLMESLLTFGIGIAGTAWLLVSFLILGSVLGWPVYSTAVNAMIADIVSEEKRAQAYGLLRVVQNLGAVIGPSIGGFIISLGSYFLAFTIAALLSFIFFLISLFLVKETKPSRNLEYSHESSEKHSTFSGSYSEILKNRHFIIFCFISILVTVIYAQLTTTFPVFLKEEKNMSENLWGILMAMNALMVVLFQFPLTRKSEKFSKTRVLALGSLFYAFGFGSFSFISEFYLFSLGIAILTIGEMLCVPTFTAFVADIAPEAMRGRYMAMFGMVWSVGYGLGPIIGGRIMDMGNRKFIWNLTFILGILGFIFYVLLDRKIKRKSKLQRLKN